MQECFGTMLDGSFNRPTNGFSVSLELIHFFVAIASKNVSDLSINTGCPSQ